MRAATVIVDVDKAVPCSHSTGTVEVPCKRERQAGAHVNKLGEERLKSDRIDLTRPCGVQWIYGPGERGEGLVHQFRHRRSRNNGGACVRKFHERLRWQQVLRGVERCTVAGRLAVQRRRWHACVWHNMF